MDQSRRVDVPVGFNCPQEALPHDSGNTHALPQRTAWPGAQLWKGEVLSVFQATGVGFNKLIDQQNKVAMVIQLLGFEHRALGQRAVAGQEAEQMTERQRMSTRGKCHIKKAFWTSRPL